MRTFSFCLLTALALSGCNSKSEQFCGTFSGTLPAASNPGIETTINFDKDHTFKTKLVYIDEQDGTFYENGTYQRRGSLLTVRPADDDLQYYQIENGQIRRLDTEKQPITGPLADFYVLKQTRNCK